MSYGLVLGLAGVRELLLATMLSRLATRMFLVALVLYTLGRFASPELAGWVGFAALIPGMVVSPLAGALLDRVGAGRAVVIDLAISALLVAGLAVADALGNVGAAGLLGLCGVFALTSPLSASGVRTLLPRLVPAELRDRVNALDTTVNAAVDVAGPLVAGPLIGFAGPVPTFAVIAALYAVACCAVLPAIRREGAPPSAAGGFLEQAREGVAYVFGQPTLRWLAASYSLQMASWGMLLVIVPVAVGRAIGVGPAADSMVGMLWAAAGCAGIVGALTAGRMGIMGRERATIALGGLATAVALWPVGATAGLIGLAAGMLLLNFAAGPVDVAVLTLRQRRTDPARLGRVLAVSMSLNMSGLPIGSAIGGLLMAHATVLALVAAALASLLSAAVIALVPNDASVH